MSMGWSRTLFDLQSDHKPSWASVLRLLGEVNEVRKYSKASMMDMARKNASSAAAKGVRMIVGVRRGCDRKAECQRA